MSNISLSSNSGPQFVLLKPNHLPARQGQYFNRILFSEDVSAVLKSVAQSEIVAVDFETKGADPAAGIEVVGMGLAWDKGSCYIPFDEITKTERDLIISTLQSHMGLIAHNVYFDGAVMEVVVATGIKWQACTYALLAMLHNESPESRWGLKDAQVNLLKWADSNEGELDEWLVVNGYYRGNRRLDNSPEYLSAEYKTGKLRADKGEMWRAPVEILGKYCCLDAESTYLLYTEILRPTLRKFPDFETFFYGPFMHLIEVLIHQKLIGIEMNVAGLKDRAQHLDVSIADLATKFITHPDTAPHIQKMHHAMVDEIREKEPPKHKKDGGISKNWTNWTDRISAALRGELEDYRFNINSGPQLRELLYTHLNQPVHILTEKQEPATSIKALRKMGELGTMLVDRMWLTKELSYINKYIDLTASKVTIHPSFRIPGTITGRLSSKEPNLQQVPKSKAVMSLFRARPGTVWVDLDFSALEPVVATEFSGDPNMMAIYGNGRPSNDIYLFVGAAIPGMGDKIRATGYDPYNPSKEALARAKKECKHERSICKTVTLACQYGAGVRKVHQTLEEQDIYLDMEQVETIHGGYWQLFAGVKEFSRDLYSQWRSNKGYVLNGMGRPMAVPEDYTQDLLNRFVQSTGHDILTMYVHILSRRLHEAGLSWNPLIMDWHDASTIEVAEDQADRAVAEFNGAMAELNDKLQGTIQLRGTAVVGRTLADVKEPEE